MTDQMSNRNTFANFNVAQPSLLLKLSHVAGLILVQPHAFYSKNISWYSNFFRTQWQSCSLELNWASSNALPRRTLPPPTQTTPGHSFDHDLDLYCGDRMNNPSTDCLCSLVDKSNERPREMQRPINHPNRLDHDLYRAALISRWRQQYENIIGFRSALHFVLDFFSGGS